MSASKARMYLISLIETGLVAQNPQTGLYSLGPYARHLGTRALRKMGATDAVHDSMRSLQGKTRALVLLCNWQESGIVIVAAEDGGEPHPVQWRIGGTASLASTATGAVFLAFGPQNAVWKRLAAELKSAGLSAAARKKRIRELEARAERIRASGVAEADPVVFAAGVTISGYAAIAAPVFSAGKQLSAVLTLIYRTDRPHRRKSELLGQALEAARAGPAP
jgi:DNA-binding IclR family transcriptional regulator